MKNQANIETVDKSRHAKLRVKDNPDFSHAREFNLASIMLGELSACTSNFPVLFVQHPDTQTVRPVAMFGLRPGENVYYGKDGWDSTYAPLMVQRHPFTIGFDDRKENNSTELTTCLITDSPFLSEEDGVALFTESGENTDYLASRHRMLQEIFEGEKLTEQFTSKLIEMDLLSPFEMLIKPETGEVRKITGMLALDERKLRALSPEKLQQLHKLDFLPACYIILASLFQIHNLMNLRNRKEGFERVIDYRIELYPESTPAPAAA
jgi:hypothetical protein